VTGFDEAMECTPSFIDAAGATVHGVSHPFKCRRLGLIKLWNSWHTYIDAASAASQVVHVHLTCLVEAHGLDKSMKYIPYID
jgi:hypothetical protein